MDVIERIARPSRAWIYDATREIHARSMPVPAKTLMIWLEAMTQPEATAYATSLVRETRSEYDATFESLRSDRDRKSRAAAEAYFLGQQ